MNRKTFVSYAQVPALQSGAGSGAVLGLALSSPGIYRELSQHGQEICVATNFCAIRISRTTRKHTHLRN